jgi:3D (Asp-Asp-Asp) domain-containing protein
VRAGLVVIVLAFITGVTAAQINSQMNVLADEVGGLEKAMLQTRSDIATLAAEQIGLQSLLMSLDGGKRILSVSKRGMKTTGYSNDPYSINVPKWRDGLTATNTLARVGIAAADWRLYPPGTMFYVPGYGVTVVEDRGSAVIGEHLDLFFDTYEEAIEWGVRSKQVYHIVMTD